MTLTPQGDDGFTSSWKPVYDELVRAPRSVAEAVSMCLIFQEAQKIRTPKIYVSTAITSAGFKRDRNLPFDEVVSFNNRTASLALDHLNATNAPGIYADEVMVPTELGKVPNWADTHYLAFYFSWLNGLSVDGAAWLEGRLEDAVLTPIITAANARDRANSERWPFYQQYVEILLSTLAMAVARRGGQTGDPCQALVQLIDTSESLGCRAEEMYADVRGIDRLAVTYAEDLPEPLGPLIRRLEELKASVGVARRTVQLVPVKLR